MDLSKNKVQKEVAILEMQKFVEKWDDVKKEDYEIEKDYPHVLQAIQEGFLVIGPDMKPQLKLKYPIKTDEGNIAWEDVNFRTRIRPNDLAEITKGLDIGKFQVEYTLRCFAYLTGESKGMLNKLEKFDWKVIEQLATVFL